MQQAQGEGERGQVVLQGVRGAPSLHSCALLQLLCWGSTRLVCSAAVAPPEPDADEGCFSSLFLSPSFISLHPHAATDPREQDREEEGEEEAGKDAPDMAKCSFRQLTAIGGAGMQHPGERGS